MRRMGIGIGLAGLLAAVTFGSPAGAIVYGQPAPEYDNVGSLVVVFQDEAGDTVVFQWCSGTLIDEDTFLTAAHCLFGFEGLDMYVTFDDVVTDQATLYSGRGIPHPEYTNFQGIHGRSDPRDVGVFELDEAPQGIEPADLAPVGYLDAATALRRQPVVAVGYGAVRETRRKAFAALLPGGERRKAQQSVQSLTRAWLILSMNQATGNGGTCYGDSGGPHFLDGLVVSVTSTGDAPCKATDVTYRVDTAVAQDFLRPFLS